MMAGAERQPDAGIGWGAPASLLVHALLLALLVVYLPKPAIFSVPDEGSVSVDIVPLPSENALAESTVDPRLRETEAVAAPPAPSVVSPSFMPLQPPAPKIDPPAAAFVQARRLYSGTKLSDPRSRKAKAALRQLSGDERKLQLCGLEAMEQVRRSRPGIEPDAIAPYAMAPEKIRGDSIDVEGGAFRSKRMWYAIRFRCEVEAASGAVRSFSFAVGDLIPRDLWQDHNLVADDGAAD
jgi:hypothetical protein